MEDRPSRLRRIELGVEARIRELRDSGALTGLPGEGRPLPSDPDADADDAWAARHVVRTSGARPEWADLRREIGERRARLIMRLRSHLSWLERRAVLVAALPAERIVAEAAATRDTDARVRAQAADGVAELNALVRQHNLLVTAASLHLSTMSLDSLMEIARGEARPRAHLASEA